jgi:cell division protein FtsZ
MSEDVLAEDVDTATKMITDTAADDVEFIFGTAFKEDMQDEMTITVIAAGFGEPKSVINARAEKAVVEQPAPVVEVPPVMPQAQKPAAKPSISSDEDDLDAIFKILDNKK